ncbi:hypothetical protein [Rhizobium sp. BR 362]|uniref:hypothetical protein n=1 Tax=Rhizobium sp. BR 362 TaxID=3040670 RepID=UPI002F421696
MNDHPAVDIHALRQIGWDNWDPIGIRQIDDVAWRSTAADEYDTYLFHVANMILGGTTSDEAAAYLDRIASDNMAVGPVKEAGHHASLRTVEAISAYMLDNGSNS